MHYLQSVDCSLTAIREAPMLTSQHNILCFTLERLQVFPDFSLVSVRDQELGLSTIRISDNTITRRATENKGDKRL